MFKNPWLRLAYCAVFVAAFVGPMGLDGWHKSDTQEAIAVAYTALFFAYVFPLVTKERR